MSKNTSILAQLPEDTILNLIPGMTGIIYDFAEVRIMNAGDIIASQNETLKHLILPIDKDLRLFKTDDKGVEHFLGYLQKGRTLGMGNLFDLKPLSYSVKTEETTRVIFLPTKAFFKSLEAAPELFTYLKLITRFIGVRTFKQFLEQGEIKAERIISLLSKMNFETDKINGPDQLLSGPTLYFIESGEVTITGKKELGLEFSKVLREGAWFGGEALVPPHQYSYSVTHVKDLVVHQLPLKYVDEFIKNKRIIDNICSEPWIELSSFYLGTPKVLILSDLPGDLVDDQYISQFLQHKDFNPSKLMIMDNDYSSFYASIYNIGQILNVKCSQSVIESHFNFYHDNLSILRIAEAVEQTGLFARSIKIELHELSKLVSPSLLVAESRLMIFLGLKGEKVILFDSCRGTVSMNKNELAELWNGETVEVYNPEKAILSTTAAKEEAESSANKYINKDKKKDSSVKKNAEKIFWEIFSSHNKLIISACLISLVAFIVSLAPPFFSQMIIDEALTLRDKKTLTTCLMGLGLSYAVLVVIMYFQNLLFSEFSVSFDYKLSSLFYKKTLRLDPAFFAKNKVGDVLTRMAEVQNIRSFFSGETIMSGINLASVIIYSLILAIYSPQIALIPFGGIALIILIQYVYKKVLRGLHLKIFDLEIKSSSLVSEIISCIATVKAFGSEGVVKERFEGYLVDAAGIRKEIDRNQNNLSAWVSLVTAIVETAGIWLACKLVFAGILSPGKIFGVSIYLRQVISPATSLVNFFMEWEEVKVSFQKLEDIIGGEPEEAQDKTNISYGVSLRGKIHFDRVSFRYADDAPWILRELTFTIYPRQTVAIVGQSGCGKTTLANIIAGTIKPTSGRIFFDDYDREFISLDSLRKQVGFIQQSNELFAGSISSNISFCTDLPDQALMEKSAIESNSLEFINKFPQKYDTFLSEGGMGLSGGQKQRLSIARTLYNGPKILIMDEATSALDSDSEKAIVDNMKYLLKGKTSIVIAHRLSTIKGADNIIVMQEGKVVEQGKHNELINGGGHYSELFEDQAK